MSEEERQMLIEKDKKMTSKKLLRPEARTGKCRENFHCNVATTNIYRTMIKLTLISCYSNFKLQ